MALTLPLAPSLWRRLRAHPALCEGVGVFVLFMVWQFFVGLCDARSAGALSHGRAIASLESRLHFPSEVAFQSRFVAVPRVLGFLDKWYLWAHWLVTPAVFVWLWCRHRPTYLRWRTVIVASTVVTFFIQLWPAAPPRVAMSGVLDSGATFAAGASDLVAANVAFPSLHIVWACCVGLALFEALPPFWRWYGVAYTSLTVVAVVATGNHYWLDCVAAVLIVTCAAVLRGGWEVRRA